MANNKRTQSKMRLKKGWDTKSRVNGKKEGLDELGDFFFIKVKVIIELGFNVICLIGEAEDKDYL